MQDPEAKPKPKAPPPGQLIPTVPPPKRPGAAPDEDEEDPAQVPTQRPASPPHAPSQREAGRHRVGRQPPPEGTPEVIDRGRARGLEGIRGAGILLLTR